MNSGLKASGQGTDGVPPPIEHSSLAGLGPPADDHLQYLLLAGRVGGQVAYGSPLTTESLTLQGNSSGADPGFINLLSPVIFGAYSANPLAAYGFDYSVAEAFTTPFIGGGLNFSGTISFTGATFIYESFRGSPTITSGVTPGFAAYTVLQALPALIAGPGFNPLSPLILNAGPRVSNPTAAVRTAGTMAAVNFACTVQATLAGATMNVTNLTGFTFAPKYSTVGGSAISFGTVRGLHAQNPAVGLFQPGAGTETMIQYYAVDVDAIPFAAAAFKAGLRSQLVAATNTRMIWNIGTAESEFGAGAIHLNDNTAVKLGATQASPDMMLFWSTPTSALRFSPFFGTGGAPLDLIGTAADEWVFQQDLVGFSEIGLGFNVNAVVFGTTLPTPLSNNWFVQFAAPNGRQVQIGGEYSDVLWTAGGFIDVNGQAVSDLQAFKINSPSIVLNGGTIADLSNLYVAAMPSFGGTRMQALRVLGRTRLEGLMTHNEATLATLTADVAQLLLPANNGGRFVLLEDADASGPWIIQGILNVQVGDSFYIVNDGANAFILGHQDAAAAAIDRIISPTGANLTLGPDEMAKLWYDPVATRWRILETTGA